MTATTEVKKVRATSSGVTITMFGMTSLQVDLVPLKRGEREGPKLVCPECEDVTRLAQRYVCPNHRSCSPLLPPFRFLRSGLHGAGGEIKLMMCSITCSLETSLSSSLLTSQRWGAALNRSAGSPSTIFTSLT